jgi:pimeloyl-ACP methyl ester carboxylesterase
MLKWKYNYFLIIPIILTAIALIISIQSATAYENYLSDKKLSPISEVNTRIKDVPFISLAAVNFTLTKFGSDCPNKVAIYIHGFNRNDSEAKEEFNRIQTSLTYNNYRIPLIGFSWDSKVLWEQAKINAKENGPKLADYIISFHNKCPDTKIHLIAHSLGASVVDNALVILDKNTKWNNSKIASVHLLGAAINNNLIEKDKDFGNATENIVEKFYNLYDPEDDGLTFNQFENRKPLGLVGALKLNVPSNYIDTNIVYEIPPFSDADGDSNVEECFENINTVKVWGDNHCGYIGYRNSTTGSLLDDGAMNIVMEDWRNS